MLGGELSRNSRRRRIGDCHKVDIIGVYPNYATAYAAWQREGATDRGQCADALLHRSSASPARSRGGLHKPFGALSFADGPACCRHERIGARALGSENHRDSRSRIPAIREFETSRTITKCPADIYERSAGADLPVIIAMWHGQHFMAPFIKKKSHKKAKTLISRHRDGEMNAVAAESWEFRRSAGQAIMATAFSQGWGQSAFHGCWGTRLPRASNVALTADVPKISRVGGAGIIRLSQISGRPSIRSRWPRTDARCSTTGIAAPSTCRSAGSQVWSAAHLRAAPTPTKRTLEARQDRARDRPQ